MLRLFGELTLENTIPIVSLENCTTCVKRAAELELEGVGKDDTVAMQKYKLGFRNEGQGYIIVSSSACPFRRTCFGCQ